MIEGALVFTLVLLVTLTFGLPLAARASRRVSFRTPRPADHRHAAAVRLQGGQVVDVTASDVPLDEHLEGAMSSDRLEALEAAFDTQSCSGGYGEDTASEGGVGARKHGNFGSVDEDTDLIVGTGRRVGPAGVDDAATVGAIAE